MSKLKPLRYRSSQRLLRALYVVHSRRRLLSQPDSDHDVHTQARLNRGDSAKPDCRPAVEHASCQLPDGDSGIDHQTIGDSDADLHCCFDSNTFGDSCADDCDHTLPYSHCDVRPNECSVDVDTDIDTHTERTDRNPDQHPGSDCNVDSGRTATI